MLTSLCIFFENLTGSQPNNDVLYATLPSLLNLIFCGCYKTPLSVKPNLRNNYAQEYF